MLSEKSFEEKKEDFSGRFCFLLSQKLEEGFEAKQILVTKNNGVKKKTIVVRKAGCEYAPSFYEDELFRSVREGRTVEQLADEIAKVVQNEYRSQSFDGNALCEKEFVEENLYLQLIHREQNRELLEGSVFVEMFDLAAVFYVLTEQSFDGIKSFRLPKAVWEKLEFGDPKAYFEKALRNTEKHFPATVKDLEESVRDCLQKEFVPDREEFSLPEGSGLLYVVTNKMKINGAVSVLYPGMLQRLFLKFGNFYLIPSSIHEMLVVPEKGESDAEILNRMVKEVNGSQLIPEEVLSDHVYFYSEETGLKSC